jgi:hypothetical protein
VNQDHVTDLRAGAAERQEDQPVGDESPHRRSSIMSVFTPDRRF